MPESNMRLIPVMMPVPDVGMRVIVRKDFDRTTELQLDRDYAGKVVEVRLYGDGSIANIVVQLDEHLPQLDEWDNCVNWQWEHAFGDPNGIPANVLYDFWQDCRLETAAYYGPDYRRARLPLPD